jgi:GTP-binding protein
LEIHLGRYHKSVVPARAASAHLPLVAIVGRPNVGKSTLFNRLTKTRRSIVGDEPGITRDRIYGEYEWGGRIFRVVDTGGMVPDDPDLIPSEIYNQARVALGEADALIFVVDVRTELASPDMDLARLLLKGGKPVFLAVNKVEGLGLAAEAENFRQLGFKQLFAVSAEHAQGIGDLLEAIGEALPEGKFDSGISEEEEAEESDVEDETELKEPSTNLDADGDPLHRTHGEFEPFETSIAIIGRPNVGKSTLLNALTGTNRAIVSPIAGTTRDAVDEVVEYKGKQLRFVDTAGEVGRGDGAETS